MFSPPDIITSFCQSTMVTLPTASNTARSPVWNQPARE